MSAISDSPTRYALVWVAGGSGRVFMGWSRTPHLSSIRRTGCPARSGANARRAASPCSPRVSSSRVQRIGAANVASPFFHRSSARAGAIHSPEASSPGWTLASWPAGARARKNDVSNRAEANGGVCQRPAKSSASARKRHPYSRASAGKLSPPSRRRRADESVAAGCGSVSPTRRPISSRTSRIAHARSRRSRPSATPSTSSSASSGRTVPPTNAWNPGM